MRKIYLVKKNPEQPADGNNWIVMNSFEFMNFVKTPEGQKRRECFGQLDACSVDDVIIIAECGTETAKQWRSEKDRHDYLASIEKQSGMTVFSYNTQTTAEDEMSGEELLADNQCDVVEEVLRRFQKAHIQETLTALLPEERDLIESLILSDFPMTEREYAKKVGKTQSTIHCQKAAILKRLKICSFLKVFSFKSKKFSQLVSRGQNYKQIGA